MDRAITFTAKVEGGHLPVEVRANIAKVLQAFEGGRIEVAIKKASRTITCPQRRYYFKVIVEAYRLAFADQGEAMTKEETHDWIKRNVTKRGKNVKGLDGTISFVPDSLKRQSMRHREEDNERCRAHLAQFGYEVPLPNEKIVAGRDAA